MFDPKGNEEYRNAVMALAAEKANRRLLNDSAACAKDLADLMIGHAEADTVIYSGHLREECYREAMLSAKGRIRILVDDPSGAKWISEVKRPGLEIREAVISPDQNHFFVVDGTAFRYERDHKKAAAIANFNEPPVCASLTAKFDAVWDEGTPIS